MKVEKISSKIASWSLIFVGIGHTITDLTSPKTESQFARQKQSTRYWIIQKRWSDRRNESGNKGEMLRSMNVLLGMVVNQKRWREARAHFFDFAISQRSFRSTTACLTYCPTRFFYCIFLIMQYRVLYIW